MSDTENQTSEQVEASTDDTTPAADSTPVDSNPPAVDAAAIPATAPVAKAELTLRQLLSTQGKLDDDLRIGNMVINTNQGVVACAPEFGKIVDGEFELTSTLGELRLSPEGVKLLRNLKGNSDESIVTTLKRFLLEQTNKKLDEPVSTQQVQAQ